MNKTQLINLKEKKKDVVSDTNEIQKVIREYCENLCSKDCSMNSNWFNINNLESNIGGKAEDQRSRAVSY